MELIIKDKNDILKMELILSSETDFSEFKFFEQLKTHLHNHYLDFIMNAQFIPLNCLEKPAFIEELKNICLQFKVFTCLYHSSTEIFASLEPIYAASNLALVPTESEAGDMVRLSRIEHELNLPND